MSYKSEIRMNDRHRRERRVWRNGLAVSAIVHLLVFFAWRITAVPISPYVASGPRQGEDRADERSVPPEMGQPNLTSGPPIDCVVCLVGQWVTGLAMVLCVCIY